MLQPSRWSHILSGIILRLVYRRAPSIAIKKPRNAEDSEEASIQARDHLWLVGRAVACRRGLPRKAAVVLRRAREWSYVYSLIEVGRRRCYLHG